MPHSDKPSKIKAAFKTLGRFFAKARAVVSRLRFLPTRNFLVYLCVWLFGLIFTQALRSPLSGVFFLFIIFLPLACLLHLLLSPIFIHAYVGEMPHEVHKLTPVNISASISNESLIPYPFVEVDMSLPDKNAVRCNSRRAMSALMPFGAYKLSRRVSFSYRGDYEVGISSLYVYDFFRMFRLRLDFDALRKIFVMPRRLTMTSLEGQVPSDWSADSSNNVIGVDRSELADIREYRIGDHMKTIHWQLSSKTTEPVVKEYAMTSGKTVYIFADLSRAFEVSGDDAKFTDDANEFAADGIVEASIAAASHELNDGNGVTLIWYDGRTSDAAKSVQLQTPTDLSAEFKTFATAPLLSGKRDITRLMSLTEDSPSALMLFVTSDLSAELYDGLSSAAALFGGVGESRAISVVYHDIRSRVVDSELAEFDDRVDAMKARLGAIGVNVIVPEMI